MADTDLWADPPITSTLSKSQQINNFWSWFGTAPDGTVIRWQEGRFHYVALKAAGHWYTTATEHNTRLAQVLTGTEMANHLSAVPSTFTCAATWVTPNLTQYS